MKKTNTAELVQISMFSAIIILLSFLPYVGYIKLPIGIQATTIHIPVIVGSILLGPKVGGMLGFVFGLTSFVNNTIQPGLLSFCFSPITALSLDMGWVRALIALCICFIPRIICGMVPYYVYNGIKKLFKNSNKIKDKLYILLSGVAGSLTNTILVMGMILLFFAEPYAEKMSAGGVTKTALAFVLTTVTTNGVFEAVTAAIISSATVAVINKSKSLLKR